MAKNKGRIRKKYEAGAATNYVTRKQALRRLQLTLKDFRRLCILKGIHPHEPLHKKKVNKGSTEIRTWYYVKDINFLAHEPIIKKFRAYKIFLRKLKRAKEKRERERADHLVDHQPRYTLSHIVKERFPTFVDAVRDLDDALCLCFLFSRMAKSTVVNSIAVQECRKLTTEFFHYIIASASLRKVFVSIKGIYYQANVMGEKVTWICPHERMQPPATDVDFSVMSIFLEFYRTMLGSVNCRLYHQIGLHYPPKLESFVPDQDEEDDTEAEKERIYSLGTKIVKVGEDVKLDEQTLPDVFAHEDESDEMKKARAEEERVRRLKTLFKGKKIFLGREVPRESLVFVIRACGGEEVSWDSSVFYGSTFQEDDPTITHQISDRPQLNKKNVNRLYVQPQWVYDSINVGRLLPPEEYFLGVELPPHLSPFVEEKEGDYIPPERLQQINQELGIKEDVEAVLKQEENEKNEEMEPAKKKLRRAEEKKEMRVEKGKSFKKNPQLAKNEKSEEQKMKESMIPKKHKRLYHKIKKGTAKKTREVKKLEAKRAKIDATKTK